MESSIDLQQPVLDGGIRSINFFNGRMLTARDLTREQTANRELTRRLGQAVGDGIAYGLELSKSKSNNSTPEFPLVTVEQGLAVNRQGQTLWLRDKTDVALVRKASANTAGVIFSECRPLQAGTYVAGAGVYLLTVAPAETREGRAVTSALNTGSAACNTDALVSAVQFRLIQIDPPITSAELANTRLRNLLAYKCFGVSETEGFLSDPLGRDLEPYGLLDGLRPNVLTDCDVPLGVLYWTLNDGIKFIDMWSVRRRLTHRSSGGQWSRFVDDRFLSEGEAKFLQFQEHIGAISGATAALKSIKATDHFFQLPAAGIIPLATEGTATGFDCRKFFQDQTYREPRFMEGARLQRLIRESFSYPPITLDSGEAIWLYQVRQNMQTIAEGRGNPQPCLIFSSGHMPYFGEARFDLNRYNYSNYSSVYD
ncbi:MAG: hypothetical protein QOF62_2398 [Pyrinomonadaceae bacterium]|nr:hypothetical protein [Pyrinomonadaceae bacterium]